MSGGDGTTGGPEPAGPRAEGPEGGRWPGGVDVAAALVVAWVAATFFLEHPFGEIVFTADQLLGFTLLRDLREGLPALRGWTFHSAPYVFPDLLLAWLSSLLFRDVRLAVLACTLAQALALVVAGLAVARAAADPGRRRLAGALCLLLLLVTYAAGPLVSTTLHREIFGRSLALNLHGGALAGSLACLYLAARHLGRPRPLWLGLMAAVATATHVSDRMFFVQGTAPILATAALLAVAWPGARRALGSLALALVAASLLAEALNVLLAGQRLPLEHHAAPPVATLHLLRADLAAAFAEAPLYAAGTLALPLLLTLGGLARLRPGPGASLPRALVLAAPLVSVVFTVVAVVFSWRYSEGVGLRLLQSVLLLQVSAALAVASRLPGSLARPGATALPPALVVAGLLLSLLPQARPRRIVGWTDLTAECIRRLGPAVSRGLGHRWNARTVEPFLDGVLIDPVDTEATASLRYTNLFRFLGGRSGPVDVPQYDFVVETEIPAPVLDAAFGPPDRRLDCGPVAVRVFDRPNALGPRLLRRSPGLVDEALARTRAVRLPAWLWASRGHDLVARRVEVTEPGLVLAGSVPALPGLTRFALEYRSGGGGGVARWDLCAGRGQECRKVAAGTLPATAAWTSAPLPPVSPEAHGAAWYGLRVFSETEGPLELREVAVSVSR